MRIALVPLLDRELNRLPKKYRSAIVVCDLEGRTRREAARLLNIAEGTLSSRLATGRQMLARRLTRCGVSLSGGALDPVAVLRACGDDEELLRVMCRKFHTYLPDQLAEVGDALRDQDAPRLS